MTIPVILQFLATIYKWVCLEKRNDKNWSWIILLLQFWPQWRAIQIMRLDFKQDAKAQEKKKEFMREITTTEPFLEAWPTIIIMAIIWVSARNDGSFWGYCNESGFSYINGTKIWNNTECSLYLNSIYQPPEFCKNHTESTKCAVYGGLGGEAWFIASFIISIMTGSFGITKFLQVGPFSVLSTDGFLGGIFKCRFVLALLTR